MRHSFDCFDGTKTSVRDFDGRRDLFLLIPAKKQIPRSAKSGSCRRKEPACGTRYDSTPGVPRCALTTCALMGPDEIVAVNEVAG